MIKFCGVLVVLVSLVAALFLSGVVTISTEPVSKAYVAPVDEYDPLACSMPMCEALGGSDAITLSVMSGD